MIFDVLTKPRIKSVIGTGQSWLIEALGSSKTKAGVAVSSTEQAMSYSAVWGAVRILAQSIAQLPWHVMTHSGPNGDRQHRVPDHPVDWALNRQPNSWMTAVSFREAMIGSAVLWGNGYAVIGEATNGGRSLTPLEQANIQVKIVNNRLLYEQFQPGSTTPVATWDQDQIFHLRGLSWDGLVGMSLAKHAKESWGLGLATERFGATWFGFGSRPGGYLKHPARLEDRSRENLRKSMEQIHQGPDKANRLAILEEGMDWVQGQVAPEESQFLQTRTFQIQEVSRYTGVPPHMLAELSRATFSNIEHQAIEFVRYALTPWIIRLEAEADIKLFRPPVGRVRSPYFTKINEKALLRGDTKTRGEFYKTLFNMGAVSPNEVRRWEDLNPIGQEGNRHYIQVNMAPLEDVAQGKTKQQQQPGIRMEALKKADMRVFAEAAQRIVNRECIAARRAAKRPIEAWKEWLRTFYRQQDKQQKFIADTIRPLMESLAERALGEIADMRFIDNAAGLIAMTLCEEARTELEKAYHENSYDGSSVDDLCDLWMIERGPRMAEMLTDRTIQIVEACYADSQPQGAQ